MRDAALGSSMSDADFRHITAIAAKEAGLAIPDTKRSLVQSRIVRRMRNLGLTSCRQYLEHLEGNFDETQNLISALTTNVSHFFRELHHFEYLRNELLDQSAKQLRFWSAGCSNGQEPYSLAIEILKKIPDAASRDILILATDIDETVLANAAEGSYTESDIKGVPEEERTKFFQKVAGDTFEVDEALKRLVRFKKLNLNAESWPMSGPFDAIFCRNVVIYFNEETQARLWPRFHALLRPDGVLMLGHSERIHPVAGSGFVSSGITTYRKSS